MQRELGVAALLLLLSYCGGDSGHHTNQNSSPCPEGFLVEGPACVPIFDDCPGPAEIAVLGGGCQPVGVTTCATGLFEPDGEGGCEPILPPGPEPCPPGSMEMLGQTECQPVGVTACATGFESDGEGGCDAILPPGLEPCPSGTIALLGHTACQPLGDCGSGTWGNIADDPSTVYVDQAANPTGANGTSQAPFVTIGEALSVAAPGAQIAIAAGDYSEALLIDKTLRLSGRCVALVTIRGVVVSGEPQPPVTIEAGGTNTTVRGITLTGPGYGLLIVGAQQILVEEVQVLDASDIGVAVGDDASVSLRRVVVSGCTTVGVGAQGGMLELHESVVQDTRPQPGTNAAGHGIEGLCMIGSSSCGTLRLSSSLITSNWRLGVASTGLDTEVSGSVVRNTRSELSSGRLGRGIAITCDPNSDYCPTLLVSSSLLDRNREVSLWTGGARAEVVDTVVRDTQPEEGTRAAGWGIDAECIAEGVCGSLRVSTSLVSGNQGEGIASFGVPVEITSTIVRHTQLEESTGLFGTAISATCMSALSCGSLKVASCLISSNCGEGVLADGADEEVTKTIIRNPSPLEDAGDFGGGVLSQCHSESGRCGSFRISSSLVIGARHYGVGVSGTDGEISTTVARDTHALPGYDSLGVGLSFVCDPNTGDCGQVEVISSLIAGSRGLGLHTHGMNTSVYGTVIRDTLPDDVYGVGRGINANCSLEVGSCGSLRVNSSLISRNQGDGVFSSSVNTEILASIIRDTLPDENTLEAGRGLTVQCDPFAASCGHLLVDSCLVSGNRDVGVFVAAVETVITASVLRDTRAQESDGTAGRGLTTRCHPDIQACGSLDLSASVIRGNVEIGVVIVGMPTSLQGVAVIGVRPDYPGPWQELSGHGLWALCDADSGHCGSLSVSSSLVAASHGVGLGVEGVSGFMTNSLVRSVPAQPSDGKYGYGVQIAGGVEQPGQELPTFHVSRCQIQDAKLAGIFYFGAGGTLGGSVVSGAENSVVMNEGSTPILLDDNTLSGTVKDEPTWANLFPSPAPPPSVPSPVTN